MQFNKITRGHNRSVQDLGVLYEILDAGFMCQVAFQADGKTMMIPTAYGRKENTLYFHGSTKNHMLNEIIKGQEVCVSVTHLDGIVLARSLFDTSANYRSVIMFGQASLVTDEEERMNALYCITENIIPGRWEEVPVGQDNQLNATMVVRFEIDSLSIKVRTGGPQGDEALTDPVWSGEIPLKQVALPPIQDLKFDQELPTSKCVAGYYEKNKM